MTKPWGERAQRRIAEIMNAMPADATLDDRRRALPAASSAFAEGTSWGRKVWPKQCRLYLAKFHGGPSFPQPRKDRLLYPADIVFPFRSATHDPD